MSETVTKSGKIELIPTPDGLTSFEKAKWMVENLDVSFEEYDEGSKEAYDENYLFLQGQWYRVVESFGADTGDFCNVQKVAPDTFTFFCQYYTGATYLEEVLETGMIKLDQGG